MPTKKRQNVRFHWDYSQQMLDGHGNDRWHPFLDELANARTDDAFEREYLGKQNPDDRFAVLQGPELPRDALVARCCQCKKLTTWVPIRW
jgi:hypothetical protein